MERTEMNLVCWAGWAGLLAALGWVIGDVLIVGHLVSQAEFPLLFHTYGDRIDPDIAERVIGVSHVRLIIGALLPAFALPLYLIGVWHLWRGVCSAGRLWAVTTVVLLFLGYTWSPVAHAAFYFVGILYQMILVTSPELHPQLLATAAEFRHVLLIMYIPSVTCSFLGFLTLSLSVGLGRTAYPRWFAVTGNPLLLGVLCIDAPRLFHGEIADALRGAGLNTAQFLIYLQSIFILQKTLGKMKNK